MEGAASIWAPGQSVPVCSSDGQEPSSPVVPLEKNEGGQRGRGCMVYITLGIGKTFYFSA